MTKKRSRTIVREIVRRVPIENGDVVVLLKEAIGGPADQIGIFNAMRNALGTTGREKCILIVLDDLAGIQKLNEGEMKSYGWCRCLEEESEEVSGLDEEE